MKTIQRSRGLTLIELVVVVGLLAALSMVALSFQTSALPRGRNSRRVSEIEQLRNALEQYRADHSNAGYPDSLSTLNSTGYTKVIPVGPQGLNYQYTPNATDSFKYCLCAPMEDTGDVYSSECTPPSGFPPSGYLSYCVLN